MRLTVIGTGHLGAVHAACMADIGHEVLGVDSDPEKIRSLAAGRPWFFEPGLEELLERGASSGALRWSSSLADAAKFGDAHFICVGTPQQAGSLAADVSSIQAVIDGLGPALTRDCLLVGKSTVPVGTASAMAARLAALTPPGVSVEVAWNPEFLREGYAVADTLRPDRIVAGVSSAAADATLRAIYAPILADDIPYITTDLPTSELVKVAANAFLATKISFINAMADLCEASGADVVTLSHAIGHDARIGHRGMSAGLGYGGGCLPKDVRALIARGEELGAGESLRFLHEVEAINAARRTRAVQIATELVGGSCADKNIAALGAAFKAGTSDVRDSPALAVAAALAAAGARVRVHDPEAADNVAVLHPELEVAPDLDKACTDADVVLHLTDWPQYRAIDPTALREIVRKPVIFDSRNVLPLDRWQAAGWVARGLGVRTLDGGVTCRPGG